MGEKHHILNLISSSSSICIGTLTDTIDDGAGSLGSGVSV